MFKATIIDTYNANTVLITKMFDNESDARIWCATEVKNLREVGFLGAWGKVK